MFTETICPEAYKLELLSVKDDTLPVSEWTYALVSSYDKHQVFANETYGKVSEETVKEEATKYTCDNGTIVAVTYGGKDGDDSAAYRTFILNYNSFTVKVEYNGTTYELPGYGYLVINY